LKVSWNLILPFLTHLTVKFLNFQIESPRAAMNKEPNENDFIALEIPESAPFKEEQSGGLNFIQSNYDFNNTKSSDNSSSSINFGDMGNFTEFFFHFYLSSLKHSLYFARARNSNSPQRQSRWLHGQVRLRLASRSKRR
jgi:hypothetical protein